MCHSNDALVCRAMRTYPDKLTLSDLRVYDALLDNSYLLQTDIANLLDIGVRSVERSVATLEKLGLIEVKRVYDRTRKKTRSTYHQPAKIGGLPQDQSANFCPSPQDQSAKIGGLPQDQPAKIGGSTSSESSQIAQNGQPANFGGLMNHDMSDSSKDKGKNYSEVFGLLDFLEGENRAKIARKRHVTVEYARQAREWFEARMYGDIDNPAGYLFAIMVKADPIPALQYTLPADADEAAGAIELPSAGDQAAEVAVEVAKLIPEVYPLAGEKWKKHLKRIVREDGPACNYDVAILAHHVVYAEL